MPSSIFRNFSKIQALLPFLGHPHTFIYTTDERYPDSFMLTGKLRGYIRLEQDNVKSHQAILGLHMFSEYITAALARAEYEVINDPEPYYAHVPGLEGVWATGKTFEECRKELIENIEEWIAIRLRHGFSIPPIDGHSIEVSTEPMAVG